MKEPIRSIIVKLLTLVAFVVLIIGGVYVMFSSYMSENWRSFAGGCCILAFGFYIMGVLLPLFVRYEKYGSLDGLSPLDCLSTAFWAMIIFSLFIFFVVSIFGWVERGLWKLGIVGIASFILFMIIAIEVTIRYKMDNNAPKKVKKNPDAVKHSGTVFAVFGRLPIQIIKWFPLVHTYLIDIDGVTSTAFIRHTSKLWKSLTIGSEVNVLFDPKQPKYCVILPAESDTSNSDKNS